MPPIAPARHTRPPAYPLRAVPPVPMPQAPDVQTTADGADSIEELPQNKIGFSTKQLIGLTTLGFLIIGGSVGTYYGVRQHKDSSGRNKIPQPTATPVSGPTPVSAAPVTASAVASPIPTPIGPTTQNPGISLVAAYNKAFKTNFEDSQAGFGSLKQLALGDFTTPQLFAAYACSDQQLASRCTLSEALQGNAQQVNLPLIIADEDASQRSVSVTARCDTGVITKAQSFSVSLPDAPAGNASRGFFSLLNSPDAACATNTGAALYNFHYNITANNQAVGANNSVVLFKRNALGQITNALIGVNPSNRTDALYFNAPIYNLQTSY